jgi:hypothetical protein
MTTATRAWSAPGTQLAATRAQMMSRLALTLSHVEAGRELAPVLERVAVPDHPLGPSVQATLEEELWARIGRVGVVEEGEPFTSPLPGQQVANLRGDDQVGLRIRHGDPPQVGAVVHVASGISERCRGAVGGC